MHWHPYVELLLIIEGETGSGRRAMTGSRPDELRCAVQQPPPGLTVASIMQRVTLSRSCDRDLVETALRKAGFSD